MVKPLVWALLPRRYHAAAYRAWTWIFRSDSLRAVACAMARVAYRGRRHYCALCEARLRCFVPGGHRSRPNARCPVCGSLDRHRLIWMFLRQRTDLFDGRPKRLLHVAPERELGARLSRIRGVTYLSADMVAKRAILKIDLTAIDQPDGTFDVICCSHVLEHIPDDRRAMVELCRILKPGGWAILQVPIGGETTYEDPTIQTPEAREEAFGQWDHVRVYGKDFRDRLEESGFRVRVEPFAANFGEIQCTRLGILASEDVYFCTKPK